MSKMTLSELSHPKTLCLNLIIKFFDILKLGQLCRFSLLMKGDVVQQSENDPCFGNFKLQ